MTKYHRCTKCDIIYDQQDTSPEIISCPSCGSPQTLYICVEDNITFHEWIRKVDKLAGSKRPISDQCVGDELTHDTRKWSHKERVIDRMNISYYEIVIDKKTGDVIHYCKEPLDRHFGHGSDSKNT
jgi:predicted  nucleic acid-binding Zn-ribbon protein